MKRTAPDKAETVLNKHRDILLQIFGRVNLDLDDAWYLIDWIYDNRKRLGRKYHEVQEWGYEVLDEIIMKEPTQPPKKYKCRYCGAERSKSGIIVADNAFICLGCAGYE